MRYEKFINLRVENVLFVFTLQDYKKIKETRIVKNVIFIERYS